MSRKKNIRETGLEEGGEARRGSQKGVKNKELILKFPTALNYTIRLTPELLQWASTFL